MYLKVFKPENLINFNSTNFEQKILLEDDENKIILIALEKHQELPEHFSPNDAAIFVLKGKIIFIIEEEEYIVKKQEMLVIPSKITHKVVAKDKSKFLVIRL